MKTLIPIFGLLACCLPAAAEGPHRVKIVNAAVVMPSKVVENATILIEDGRITAVGTDLGEAFEGAEVIDAAGRYTAPGFIDVHCHGGGGHDFSDGTVEAMLGAAEMHARHGTTLIYPTPPRAPTRRFSACSTPTARPRNGTRAARRSAASTSKAATSRWR